jgi:V8-like Glu-specific endopeptidase
MGTGWLIRPNLLITAGHCAYDWGDSDRPAYGRAIEVIAHVGYSGKDSVGTSSVQTRSGAKIVTTEGWLRSANHQDDVSFIQLDQPFTDVAKWTFNVTPTKGFAVIGVVGYPGDKEKNREAGAEMYEEFKTVNWNLDESPGNMLKYDISTFGGLSGYTVNTSKYANHVS